MATAGLAFFGLSYALTAPEKLCRPSVVLTSRRAALAGLAALPAATLLPGRACDRHALRLARLHPLLVVLLVLDLVHAEAAHVVGDVRVAQRRLVRSLFLDCVGYVDSCDA